MSDRPDFAVQIHQNPYLAVDGTQVHAIVRVEARSDPADAARSTSAAEVIIVDTSASMAGERLEAARQAAKAAVEALREDVDFAVVAGSRDATMVYPRDELLARASERGKAAAKEAISGLTAAGGTRIGRWLTLANALFDDSRHGIRHAVLLTDGRNEHETREELDAALARCTGRFVCDCRGVGADWEPAELRQVATRLLGGFGLVADPRDLTADFTEMIGRAMGKAVADVALRVWTPDKVSLRFLKQVYPVRRDLTGKRVERGPTIDGAGDGGGPATGDYPTGIWGTENRDYHLCFTVPVGRPYQRMQAARVSLVLPGSGGTADESLAEGLVLAEWTDDKARSTGQHPSVEHYSTQDELADSLSQGVDAFRRGDDEVAGRELTRARELAERTGATGTSKRLDEVVAPKTGEVRPRKDVDPADIIALDTEASESAARPPTTDGEGGDAK
ncbi:von Willebrand factor type A domain-containing protein [Actinomadura pelletieri DSM 43383]|uniref:von Willebrand factor type A domain-containing protein n=1 Tax=Actinomadura pelletieri DSM 43383 TaxID=1120940 RepID=A0A495QY45_9ACTN|nr:vWA domain-containing protein [Actinomadura pelletieri]RKS78944.1 von Willebrand factor type A domain-containing protein [Actinomadura pelletieri DSM 43383]